MAQKLENPYLTWLQTLQNSGTGYQQALTNWQKAVADAWQTPSAYWQTVGSIQAERADALAQWWSQAPAHAAKVMQAQGWPQWVGATMEWQGHTIAQAINLSTSTDAYRANLWQQWVNLAMRNAPAMPVSAQPVPQSAPRQQPTAQPRAQAQQAAQPQASVPAPQPLPQPAPFKPQPAPTRRDDQPSAPPAKPVVNVAHVQVQAPRPVFAQTTAPAAQDMPLLNSATGTHGSPSPAAVISPTATSVMRSSTGSTIAAAAAARRSVVARRQSRRRTPR
ncbi:MAG: hypothetical protein GC129_02645 [Proteobacteria bacterium]|nr:hypothetical protein [Pseudomonadota bacterium]